jgi:hypothetical protein
MIQQILTYLIVASAFFYAGYKISNIFRYNKNNHLKKPDDNNQPNACENCPAECVLRDSLMNIPENRSRAKTKSGL